MAEKTALRITAFKPGDVWLMQNPMRIVKIMERSEYQYSSPAAPTEVVSKPCVIALATVPDKAIPGMIPEDDVPDLVILRGNLQARDKTDKKANPGFWTEVYGERFVFPVVKIHGKALEVNDDPRARKVLQVYCLGAEDRGSRQELTSPVQNCPVMGVRIPDEDVPAGIFPGDEPEPAPVPEVVAAEEPETELREPFKRKPGRPRKLGAEAN